MKFRIQIHLAKSSISNTVLFLEVFGADRARSAGHNWFQSRSTARAGRSPNHVAIDETVIQLDDHQYWLYAAVDPGTNDLLYTKLEPTIKNGIADQLFAELCDKHDVDNAIVLIDGAVHFMKDARNTTSISNTNDMEIGRDSNVYFVR